MTTENTSSGTTAALVIVESYFGSTRTIAEATAAGVMARFRARLADPLPQPRTVEVAPALTVRHSSSLMPAGPPEPSGT